MRSSNAITLMTEDATLPMSPTMNPSRRKSARRTSERTASSTMRKLLSMRLYKFVEHLWLRTVTSRDLKSAELSMSLSAGPNRKSTMLKMMLLNVRLFKRKGAKTRPLVIHHSQNAQTGPERLAMLQRTEPQSTHPSLPALKNQENYVLLLAVASKRVLKIAMIEPKLLSKMLPRKNVLLSHRELVVMSPNLCPSLN